MSHKNVKYSVVIPTYRGAQTLRELIERLIRVMNQVGESYEVVFVDDASPDDSWEILTEQSVLHPQLRASRLMYNVGQFHALMCGFENARGEYVITMDDDLQNPPEEIPKLIGAMEANPELDGVIGAYEKKEHSAARNMGTLLIDYANRLASGKDPELRTTSFRLLRKRLVETIAAHKTMNPVMGALVVQSSKRLKNVTVTHHPRRAGRSNYTFLGLMKLAADAIFNFSVLPLRIMSFVGILSAILSAALGSYYVARYLSGNVTPGFTTLALLILFFNGVTLVCFGLVGEYLIRVIREVSHSPRYVVRDRL